MCNFSAGLIMGTAIGAAAAMIVCPPDKKDMYRNCCKAGRMMKKANRSISRSMNRAMHNFM